MKFYSETWLALKQMRDKALWYVRYAKTGGKDLADMRDDEQMRQWREIQFKTWRGKNDE